MQAAKERVLLVDDEPQILNALEDLLGDEYTVFKSDNPQRALDLVHEDHDIAVVISDQRMPQMNGDEFLSRIGMASHALRIMVSGFADLPAVLRALNEGRVYAYVTKPWDEADLLHKVQTAAEHFRLTQELEYERRLLRDLMDNSPDGIYFKDAELRFLRANASFARLIGVANPEDLVGRRMSEVLGASHETAAIESEDKLVLLRRQPILDMVRRHYGSEKSNYISETKAPIKGKSGNALGIVIRRNQNLGLLDHVHADNEVRPRPQQTMGRTQEFHCLLVAEVTDGRAWEKADAGMTRDFRRQLQGAAEVVDLWCNLQFRVALVQ